MSIIKNYRLRLDAGNITPLIIHVNQYDKNEIWNFTLIDYQGNQYITTEAAIVGKKPDGCLIAKNCTVSDGIVSVEVNEQMTAAAGKAVFELLVDGQMHGTANFVVMIERSPKDGAIESESDLSLFQRAIDATSTPAIIAGVQAWMDENLTPTTPVVDSSLSITGAAADSAKVGQEISDLKSEIALNSGVPRAVKIAMDTLFSKMAVKDDDAYTSEYATIHNWATATSITSISAEFDQGSDSIYESNTLASLRDYLTVTAHNDDGTERVITDYTLSGKLTVGTSEITVSYDGLTDTFDVTVLEATVPSGYTAYDYVSYTGNSSKKESASRILTKTFTDLNKVSYEVQVKLSANAKADYQTGKPVFGVRNGTSALTEGCCALYVSQDGIYAVTHGRALNVDGEPTTTVIPYEIGDVITAKMDNTQDPSVLTVGNNTRDYSWVNEIPVNQAIVLFNNAAPTADLYYTSAGSFQIGRMKFYSLDGDVDSLYIPAKRDSDNRIGLYDAVSGTFYTSATATYTTVGNSNCLYALGNWS